MTELRIIKGLNEWDYGYAVVSSDGKVIGFNFDTYEDAEEYMFEYIRKNEE